jgi:hypothetical protein
MRSGFYDHRRKYIKIFSPIGLAVICYAVYGIPAIASFLLEKRLLNNFYSVKNQYPYLYIVIMLLISSFILMTIKVVGPYKFKRNEIRIDFYNYIYRLYVVIISTLVGLFILKSDFYNIVYLPFKTYDYYNIINGIAEYSYEVANSESLFLFTVTSLSPLFLLYIIFTGGKYEKKIYILILITIMIVLFAAGRREPIFYLILCWVLYKAHFSKINTIEGIFIIVFCSFYIVITVLIRIKFTNLTDYFCAQEFYPLVYGQYLLVEEYGFYELDEIMTTIPIFPLLGYDGISEWTRQHHFGILGHGPTVSLNYTIIKLFPISYIMLLCIVPFVKRTWMNIYKNHNTEYDKKCKSLIIYSYVGLKFFILIRNGELGYFIWDMVVPLVLFFPLIIFHKYKDEKRISAR